MQEICALCLQYTKNLVPKGGPCESSLGPVESSPQQNLNKDKGNKADWPTNKVWTPETINYVSFFENYNNPIFFLLESVIMHKRWKLTCFFVACVAGGIVWVRD